MSDKSIEVKATQKINQEIMQIKLYKYVFKSSALMQCLNIC